MSSATWRNLISLKVTTPRGELASFRILSARASYAENYFFPYYYFHLFRLHAHRLVRGISILNWAIWKLCRRVRLNVEESPTEFYVSSVTT